VRSSFRDATKKEENVCFFGNIKPIVYRTFNLYNTTRTTNLDETLNHCPQEGQWTVDD
jgi:hypothetical protein